MTDKRLPYVTNFKHGHTSSKGIVTPEYRAWADMKTRCLKVNHKQYKDWGGRGITIYEPWIKSFQSFLDHIGLKPEPKHLYSLDRIDNNGNYEPGNVRWATKEQQFSNRRHKAQQRKDHYIPATCKHCGKPYLKHPKIRSYYCNVKCNYNASYHRNKVLICHSRTSS